MSLNLGNVTKDLSEDMSFEDAYIEWMEADHQFMNIMNAIEISEKAKASQSVECVHFAEELLGASCEVVLTGGAVHIGRHAIMALKHAYSTAKSLHKKVVSARNHLDDNAAKQTVTVSKSITTYCHGKDSNITSSSLEKALQLAEEALYNFMTLLDHHSSFASGLPSMAITITKKWKRDLKDDQKSATAISAYADFRKKISALFIEVRKLLRYVKYEK